MRTMHSVLKHGGLFWDREAAPADACAARFRRVQQAIADSGDDAWLAFGDIERHGDLVYVTNFLPRVRSALTFVPRQGEPLLLANIGLRDVPAAKTMTWVEEVRPFGRLPKEVVSLIEEKGLSSGRVGTCGFDRSLPVAEWEAIDKGLPRVQWAARDAVMTKLRATKQDWEIAALRHAAELAHATLSSAPAALRSGRSLRQSFADIDRVARRAGAEDTRFMVSFGGGHFRPIEDRTLAAGDVVTVYLSVEVQRYWAEVSRTFVLGSAGPALRDLHAKAEKALAAMAAAARHGTPAGDIARAARTALGDDALYQSAAVYGLGHGIGLDSQEDPELNAANGNALMENAVLAMRLLLRHGGHGVGLSQMVAVKTGGPAMIASPQPLVEIAR